MKLIKENTVLKVFSLFLALLLWLIVFNVSNPEQKGTRTVELNILNRDAFSSENKTWEVDRNTITVSYTVRSNQANSVKASDFNVYIDLNDYSITGSVPVYVELKNTENGGTIQDIVAKPSVVHVTVEDLQTKKFTLTTHRRGKEKDGYIVSSIHTEPEIIYATGAESAIGRISSVGVLINVDGLSESTSGKEKVVFYDANGKTIDDLENVSLSQQEAEYTVVVHKKKDLQISATTVGTPQSGYSLEGISVSPKTVSVSGNENLLEGIGSITLPALDISSVNSDVVKKYSLEDFLPKGLSLTEPNNTVTVKAKIQKNTESAKETKETEESIKSTEESASESQTESSSGMEDGAEKKKESKPGALSEKKGTEEENHQNTAEGKSAGTETKS